MVLFWWNEITGSNHLIHDAQKYIVPFNVGMAFVGNLKKKHLNSAELKSC